MDNNFDLGIIKIPLSVFKEVYENHKDFNNEGLVKKARDLINNYNCFVSNYDAKSLWEKKKIMAAQKKTTKVNSVNSCFLPTVSTKISINYRFAI